MVTLLIIICLLSSISFSFMITSILVNISNNFGKDKGEFIDFTHNNMPGITYAKDYLDPPYF